MSRGCVSCGRNFHEECSRKKGCTSCHPDIKIGEDEIARELISSTNSDEPISRKSRRENLLDPASTGRKRAAKIYPLNRNSPCEWRSLRNCGGGLRPIIGCYDGNQQHRHHGPVKETTRNELGNVHRICSACHVHWHELNDLVYNAVQYNLLPHQSEPFCLDHAGGEWLSECKACSEGQKTIINNVIEWSSGLIGKKFELASSQNRAKFLAKLDSEGELANGASQ